MWNIKPEARNLVRPGKTRLWRRSATGPAAADLAVAGNVAPASAYGARRYGSGDLARGRTALAPGVGHRQAPANCTCHPAQCAVDRSLVLLGGVRDSVDAERECQIESIAPGRARPFRCAKPTPPSAPRPSRHDSFARPTCQRRQNGWRTLPGRRTSKQSRTTVCRQVGHRIGHRRRQSGKSANRSVAAALDLHLRHEHRRSDGQKQQRERGRGEGEAGRGPEASGKPGELVHEAGEEGADQATAGVGM